MERLHVVAAVIEKDGKILICRRRNKDGTPGKWEFPGGKLEKGETQEQCLARELWEELALHVEARSKITTLTHQYEAFSVELTLYEATLLGGDIKLNVHEAAVWARRESLPEYDFLAADIQFVKELAQGERFEAKK